jgi:hypothetical protein
LSKIEDQEEDWSRLRNKTQDIPGSQETRKKESLLHQIMNFDSGFEIFDSEFDC